MSDGFAKKDDTMNYMQAVALAREGKEEGFNFLYEKTYREKYYIAIKYMKNVENAQDVLQDSYIKAFNKLDTLQDANAFPGWFGQIVANTAKNALVKKNPILFSEMEGSNDDSFKWEDQIEDDNQYYQPEKAYTAKETQEMVHELLESLSDEQRLCMLMFHIEEQSIKDIAKTLNCSENTVKSRLNYGRKKLKTQAEVLQQKGYKLYSFAPAPLLLYLLQSEKELFISTENTVLATTLYTQIASHVKMTKIAGEGISEGLKQTFIHTTAGKITVAVAGLALVGTMAAGTVWYQSNHPGDAEFNGSSAEAIKEESIGLTDDGNPNQTKEQEQKTKSKSAWKKLYVDQLEAVKADESTYRATLPSWGQSAVITYEYALVDMDKDGIPELIVNTIVDGIGTCGIYTISDDLMMTMKLTSDEAISAGVASAGGYRAYLSIPADGTGLYFCSYMSVYPDVDVTRLTIANDKLLKTEEPTIQMKTDAYNAFSAENKTVEWTDVEDTQAFQ
ncbi:RNA polymerase sigma factor [Acetobacterium carbinolicum]|uniref:RNA polymerase sigma factor n=1 Tax=Acetobacterium carbinolicum TaxID=52690 RepID=UPI0039BF34BE